MLEPLYEFGPRHRSLPPGSPVGQAEAEGTATPSPKFLPCQIDADGWRPTCWDPQEGLGVQSWGQGGLWGWGDALCGMGPAPSLRSFLGAIKPRSCGLCLPIGGCRGGAGGTLCRGAGQEPPPNPWGCRGSLPHSALGWMLQERCSAPCHPMAAALGGSQRGGGLGNGAGLLGSAGPPPIPNIKLI